METLIPLSFKALFKTLLNKRNVNINFLLYICIRSTTKILISSAGSFSTKFLSHFRRETLGTEVISEFINENFLIWAGDLSNAEPFKLSTMLGAAAYPFLAVITNNSIGGIFCEETRLRGRNDNSGSNRRYSRP